MINDHGEATGGIVEFKKFSDAYSIVDRVWPGLEAKTQLASKLVRKMNKREFYLILVDCIHQYACSFSEAQQPPTFEMYRSYITLAERLVAGNDTVTCLLAPGAKVINLDGTVLLDTSKPEDAVAS
jgi:hypothetical protein